MILTNEEIKQHYYYSKNCTGWDLDEALSRVAKAQHEKSYKQGYIDGMATGDYAEGLEEGGKSGIREAVEWVDFYAKFGDDWFALDKEKWLTKKREWEIRSCNDLG